MRSDKEKVVSLRLRGHSYTEIEKKLGIPKSTLSYWLSGLDLSDKARTRINKRVREASLKGLMKKNKIQTHLARKRTLRIRKEAQKTINKITSRELLLIGAALYWAEGYKRPVVVNGREKTSHLISFSNSDPVMIRLFMELLRKTLQIPDHRIKANIRLYEHMNAKEIIGFWQKQTELPWENFQKTSYGINKSSLGKRPYNRLKYGTIQIRVGSTDSFHKIMGWIEGLEKQFKIE